MINGTVARHLRGRVTGPSTLRVKRGRSVRIWRVEVVNHHTGQVLNSDDAYSLSAAHTEAHARVSAARAAWMYGYTKKGLQ